MFKILWNKGMGLSDYTYKWHVCDVPNGQFCLKAEIGAHLKGLGNSEFPYLLSF